MKKILLLLTILVSISGVLHAADETVTFDFSKKETITNLPTASSSTVSNWTYNNYSFSSKGCYKNTSNAYMMMGSKGYLQLPTVNGAITSVTIYVSSGCSTSATMALFKDSASGIQIGDTYTAKQNGSNTFTVSSANNSDVYFLVNGSSKNFQLTKVEINYTPGGSTGPVDYTCNDFKDYTKERPLEIEKGSTYTLDPGGSHPDITFESSDSKIASIDEDSYVITANEAGTAIITAKWDADDYFNGGDAKIYVTVKKPLETASMSFLHNVVYGKLGVGVVGQAAYYDGNGTITYTSSDESILKVNPTTGMITNEDVLRTGEVTITATASETDDFHAATASYTIIIEDPNADLSNWTKGDSMFDFSVENFYGFTSTSNSQTYETKIKEITDVEPITVTFNGNYRSWIYNGKYELRLQKNCRMTISVPDGYKITKIAVTTYNNNTSYLTLEGDKGTLSSNKKTWEDTTDNIINSVTLYSSDKGVTEIVSMTVSWEKATPSNKKQANLSFTTRFYNDLVGADINVNAVNNTNNLQVAYSIDDLVEGSDYTITDNGGNLTVTVNKAGVYTLRARSEATEEYLSGFAILRLNVFPAVELKLNDGESLDLTEEGEIVLPATGGSFTFDGNYPNTVRILYALNGSTEESLYDGTPVEFTDDDTLTYRPTYHLTYHLEYAETESYRYTTNSTFCVTPPAPKCDVNHGEAIPSDATLNFTSEEGTTLYYRVSTTAPAAYSAMRAPAATDGWETDNTNTYSFNASELPEGTRVSVSTKALHSNGRIESAVTARAFTVGGGTVTGVENIEAAADNAPVEYFNLQGIRVANPGNGIYIRRQGNTVEKVTLNN